MPRMWDAQGNDLGFIETEEDRARARATAQLESIQAANQGGSWSTASDGSVVYRAPTGQQYGSYNAAMDAGTQQERSAVTAAGGGTVPVAILSTAGMSDLMQDVANGNPLLGELTRRGVPEATAQAIVAQVNQGLRIDQAVTKVNSGPVSSTAFSVTPPAPAPAPTAAPAVPPPVTSSTSTSTGPTQTNTPAAVASSAVTPTGQKTAEGYDILSDGSYRDPRSGKIWRNGVWTEPLSKTVTPAGTNAPGGAVSAAPQGPTDGSSSRQTQSGTPVLQTPLPATSPGTNAPGGAIPTDVHGGPGTGPPPAAAPSPSGVTVNAQGQVEWQPLAGGRTIVAAQTYEGIPGMQWVRFNDGTGGWQNIASGRVTGPNQEVLGVVPVFKNTAAPAVPAPAPAPVAPTPAPAPAPAPTPAPAPATTAAPITGPSAVIGPPGTATPVPSWRDKYRPWRERAGERYAAAGGPVTSQPAQAREDPVMTEAKRMGPIFRSQNLSYNEQDPVTRARLALGDQQRAAGPLTTLADQTKSALPAYNRISPKAWLNMPRDTRDFFKSAYEDSGISANDLEDQITQNAPRAASRTGFGLWR